MLSECSSIRNIVFDVGHVLVYFSHEIFREFLKNRGALLGNLEDFLKKTDTRAYERGLLSSEEFLGKVAALLPEPVLLDELAYHWQRIFKPYGDMLSLLDHLSKTHRVFLLSNTNALHWEYLEDEYQLGSRVHGVMTSFQAGLIKPDPRIFWATAEAFSLTPQETVLVDDIAEHVCAAKALGWHAIHHCGYESTTDRLRDLGVQITPCASLL